MYPMHKCFDRLVHKCIQCQSRKHSFQIQLLYLHNSHSILSLSFQEFGLISENHNFTRLSTFQNLFVHLACILCIYCEKRDKLGFGLYKQKVETGKNYERMNGEIKRELNFQICGFALSMKLSYLVFFIALKLHQYQRMEN